MEKIIKKFKEFFLNFDLENKNVEDMIIGMEIIMSIMDTIHVEDYEAVKKLISFTRLMSADIDGLIDEDTLNDIYIRQIIPLFNALQEKYKEEPKSIKQVIKEFIGDSNIIQPYDSIDKLIESYDKTNIVGLLEGIHEYLKCLYKQQDYIYKENLYTLYNSLVRVIKSNSFDVDENIIDSLVKTIDTIELFISLDGYIKVRDNACRKINQISMDIYQNL